MAPASSCGSGGGADERAREEEDPFEERLRKEMLVVVHEQHAQLQRWAEELEWRSARSLEGHMKTIGDLIGGLREDCRGMLGGDAVEALSPSASPCASQSPAVLAVSSPARAPKVLAEGLSVVGAPWQQGINLLEEEAEKGGGESFEDNGPILSKMESLDVQERDTFVSTYGAKSWRKLAGQHFLRAVDWLQSIEEPERRGRLASALRSERFETLCNLVILGNSIATWIATDEMVHNHGLDSTWSRQADFCFLAFYTFELLFQLAVHRLYFFCNEHWAWNWFDLVLILISFADVVAEASVGNSGTFSVTFMRQLRFLRVLKTLRGLRALRFFTELRVLLACVMGTVMSMFWSIVMLVFIFYMFSLVFVQGVATQLIHEDLDADAEAEVLAHFGSVFNSMLTLYFAAFGGNDWAPYYDMVFPQWNKALFLAFIFFMQIALLNIITGIFVDNAMKFAEPDSTQKAVQVSVQEMVEQAELEHLLSELGIGERISKEELRGRWHGGRLRAHLLTLGVSVGSPDTLYDVLNPPPAGPLTRQQFARGCMLVSRPASTLDIKALGLRVDAIWRRSSTRSRSASQPSSSRSEAEAVKHIQV